MWYKNAIFYEVYIRGFYDSNGDGIGDIGGLTEKLDYLQWLGVDCIWLLPFYQSPLKDGGYDISDYYAVLPEYGNIEDFQHFLSLAHKRGIKVIVDLVINHTSDQHPWFQDARTSPVSPKRNWYVWSDNNQKFNDVRIIFFNTERSNWTWDEQAEAYYWHRFFSHQPDLNYDNPDVQDAIIGIVQFWLDIGIDGLRIDAAPYLFCKEGTHGTLSENLPETHAFIRRLRKFTDDNYKERIILAEVNQWPEDVVAYFGDGDECHMCYHFPIMPRLFMALRQENIKPIVDIMERTPPIPDIAQWGMFLRNHDELTLEMVTDEERDYLYNEFATDPKMRLNQGIRRRLAPLLDNGRRRIELLNAILFSLPGSPFLYYGDEIGMGDNMYLGDRDGVRTPMQWSSDRNAGFSRADFAQLYFPINMDPVYGYQAVNVEAQLRHPTSLLHWMKKMIILRKAHPIFGNGKMSFIRTNNPKILAFIRYNSDETVLCLYNLSGSSQSAILYLSQYIDMIPVDLQYQSRFPKIIHDEYQLSFNEYGFYWLLLQQFSHE